MAESAEFVVSDFVVAVDTREQTPYLFQQVRTDASSKYGVVPLVVRTLPVALQTGDYSIFGLESSIAIERKNVDDFISCCTYDRERFKNQLERLSQIPHGYIVVEQEFGRLVRGRYHSATNPKAVARSIFSWMNAWPTIHWLFMSRADAEMATFRILEMYWKREGPGA